MPPLPALQIRVPNPANALLQAEQILGARAQRNALARQTQQQEQIAQQFAGGIPQDRAGQQALAGHIAAIDPQQALQFQQSFNALGAQDRARVQQEGQQVSRALFGVTNQAGYDQAKSTLPPAIANGLPAEFDPQVVRSLVQASRSIDSMFAQQNAQAPTPPLSEARQAQELEQIQARRTPTAPIPRTDLGKISSDLSNGFTTPAQALIQARNAMAPDETWRPVNAQEREAYGVPEGQGAQISSTGKVATVGRGGGITIFDRSGQILAQVGGGPLTPSQTGSQAIEISEKTREATTRISELDNALQQLIETPQATGISGLTIEKLGGVAEQITDLVGVDNDWLPTADVQRTRTELAALMGLYIPTVTGDDSGRYSDQDMRRAENALPARNPTASFGQVKSALETLRDIEVRARARALMRGDGFAPGVDLTYERGRTRYAAQLMAEGRTPEQAAETILSLVDRYGIPLTVQGIR